MSAWWLSELVVVVVFLMVAAFGYAAGYVHGLTKARRMYRRWNGGDRG
jgi:hypothetical protein